jgi:hypothetical protein
MYISQSQDVDVHLAMRKCTFGVAENSRPVLLMGFIRKLNSSNSQPILLSYIMGYSKHKTHKNMSDPKHPKPIYKDNPRHEKSLWGGDVPSKKDWTVTDCLSPWWPMDQACMK